MAEGSATASSRNKGFTKYLSTPWAIVPACFLALFGLRAVLQAFRIPSGGMYPTLVIEDHVFASKLAYGVFENGVPARGDVVVFEYPYSEDDRRTSYAQRVIGLPGDTLAVEEGHAIINGWRVPSCHVAEIKVELTPGQVANHDLYVEFLDGAAYLVTVEQVENLGSKGPFVVPEGAVFTLGDNRNNSYDSRAWRGGKGGGVPLDHIEGRVTFVWWSSPLSSRFGVFIHGKPTLPPLEPSPQAALDGCLAKRPPTEKTRPPPAKAER